MFNLISKRIQVPLFMALVASTVACLSSVALAQTAKVEVDGSSTVYPLTEAVAEEFQKVNRNVRVTVGISGTGGGFKRFGAGETDISNASRPIKDSEAAAAKASGVSYVEIPVAFDGLTVVVNPKNTWVDKLTVAELKKIWEPGSTVKTWSQVRAGWPNQPLKLYGAGTDSGTYDYFTEAINGKSGACRSDFTASEDDNVLVTGVAGDPNALGFFGFSYYLENKTRLKAVPIDNGKGAVAPSETTINNGTYSPLSRPIFIYVSSKAIERAEVKNFVSFYLKNAAQLAKEIGMVPLPAQAYTIGSEHFAQKKYGSAFMGKDTIGLTITDVMAAEKK